MIGHCQAVAEWNYLQVTADDFANARTRDAENRSEIDRKKAVQNPVQNRDETNRNGQNVATDTVSFSRENQKKALFSRGNSGR